MNKPLSINARALSATQSQVWAHHKLFPGAPLYTLSALWRFKGALDVGRFTACVEHFARRHEALNVAVTDQNGAPFFFQSNKAFALDVEHIDDTSAVEAALDAKCRAVEDQEMHIENGDVFHAKLFVLPDDQYAMIVCAHYLVWDMRCFTLMMQEVLSEYKQRTDQKNVQQQPGDRSDALGADLGLTVSIQKNTAPTCQNHPRDERVLAK